MKSHGYGGALRGDAPGRVLVAAFFACTQAFAGSHCASDETEYFSCDMRGSRKVLSICGSQDAIEDANASSWLQYRFGPPGRIELSFPTERFQSLSRFHAVHLTPIDDEGVRRDIFSVYFDVGPVNYNIEVRNARRPFFGVVVTANNMPIEYHCAGSFRAWLQQKGRPFELLTLLLSK